MPRPGIRLRPWLLALLLVSLLILLLPRLLVGWLGTQGVVIQGWQGLALESQGLTLQHLALEQVNADGQRLQLQLEGVALDWRWPDGQDAYIERLSAAELALEITAPPQPVAETPSPALDFAQWPSWLPRQLRLDRFDARVPCASGQCRLQGALALQQSGADLLPARLDLTLRQAAHQLVLAAQLTGTVEAPQLETILTLDDQPRLTLQHRPLKADASGTAWEGNLALSSLPEAPWLLAWLGEWLEARPTVLANLPLHSLQLAADWRVRRLAAEPDKLRLERAIVDLRLPQLTQAELTLDGLSAHLDLSGQISPGQLALTLEPDASLAIEQLAHPQVKAQALLFDLAGLQLLGSPQRPQVKGSLALQVQNLSQARVKAQGWRWQGQLDITPDHWTAQGALSGTAGLAAGIDVQRHGQNPWRLEVTLQELFLRAGNPLQATLVDWPPLLALNNGRLNATAHLQWPAAKHVPLLRLELSLRALAGVYDRMLLEGLDGQLQLELLDNRLVASTRNLQLARLDVGVPIGPVQLSADLRAPLDNLPAAFIRWQRAETALLGGRVWLLANEVNLADGPVDLPLQLEGLQLEQLFRLYPAQDLLGSGVVDGHLPLHISTRGVRVDSGTLQARPPGGLLQFRSESIRALGRSDPGMKLVVGALEDFHYAVLASTVSYDERGKLVLALRLEGRNPQLEKGHPIHFNVTLEEDIPALLASLQLTDQVNETIKRRVQAYLQKRNTATNP